MTDMPITEFDGPAEKVQVAGPFDVASEYVTALEAEAAASPKAFYGNANYAADGHERVASALRAASSLTQRLQNLVRGK